MNLPHILLYMLNPTPLFKRTSKLFDSHFTIRDLILEIILAVSKLGASYSLQEDSLKSSVEDWGQVSKKYTLTAEGSNFLNLTKDLSIMQKNTTILQILAKSDSK